MGQHVDDQYLDLLDLIMTHGADKGDRTGTGTKSIFGHQMRFDLQDGFPLLTTKKVFTKGIIHELIWFVRGDTNIKYLVDNGVNIWNEWAYKRFLEESGIEMTMDQYVQEIKDSRHFADRWGDLGPVYGKQWRDWESIQAIQRDSDELGTITAVEEHHLDQLGNVIQRIKDRPNCRRLIVSAWNPTEVDDMALPPCHCFMQFYVSPDGKLSCQLYQRSCDTPLGVPFNIASYALLTHMVAHVCGLEVGEFIWTGGDVHIYNNQFEGVEEQLSRQDQHYPMPTLKINRKVEAIDDFTYEDFTVVNYVCHPAIKFPISV